VGKKGVWRSVITIPQVRGEGKQKKRLKGMAYANPEMRPFFGFINGLADIEAHDNFFQKSYHVKMEPQPQTGILFKALAVKIPIPGFTDIYKTDCLDLVEAQYII
jgi:hypothetical protein